jgi:hypothetical protein
LGQRHALESPDEAEDSVTPSNEEPTNGPSNDGEATAERQLQIAQQLARETLEADHQALEIDARLTFRTLSSP